jgi:transcriptional regulator with XRE-family HTH domain
MFIVEPDGRRRAARARGVDSPDLALARALRRLRERDGSTQERLAHYAGITTASLARIERGQANPAWTTVRRVASALEITLAELMAALDEAARELSTP